MPPVGLFHFVFMMVKSFIHVDFSLAPRQTVADSRRKLNACVETCRVHKRDKVCLSFNVTV